MCCHALVLIRVNSLLLGNVSMRLKKFHAKTMSEAMQMIKESLGDEAIIVASSEDRAHGGGVRVTAAVDNTYDVNDGCYSEKDDYDDGGWLQYDEESDIDAVAEEITEVMLRHCVPEDVMDNFVSCATVMGFDDVAIALVTTIEQLFAFRPLPSRRFSKPIMFVGTPGAGKTLAVAKLATRSVMSGLKVGVISTDTKRAGGIEQLKVLTDVLQIRLHTAQDYKKLRALTNEMRMRFDQVIIDTAGVNPFSRYDIKDLARLMHASDMEVSLVLPAGIDADEAGDVGRVFATLGAKSILPTRIDVARRLGSLLSCAHYGNLSFADASMTPKVAQGLTPLSPRILAQLLVPRLYRDEKDDIVDRYLPEPRLEKTGT